MAHCPRESPVQAQGDCALLFALRHMAPQYLIDCSTHWPLMLRPERHRNFPGTCRQSSGLSQKKLGRMVTLYMVIFSGLTSQRESCTVLR